MIRINPLKKASYPLSIPAQPFTFGPNVISPVVFLVNKWGIPMATVRRRITQEVFITSLWRKQRKMIDSILCMCLVIIDLLNTWRIRCFWIHVTACGICLNWLWAINLGLSIFANSKGITQEIRFLYVPWSTALTTDTCMWTVVNYGHFMSVMHLTEQYMHLNEYCLNLIFLPASS